MAKPENTDEAVIAARQFLIVGTNEQEDITVSYSCCGASSLIAFADDEPTETVAAIQAGDYDAHPCIMIAKHGKNDFVVPCKKEDCKNPATVVMKNPRNERTDSVCETHVIRWVNATWERTNLVPTMPCHDTYCHDAVVARVTDDRGSYRHVCANDLRRYINAGWRQA